MLQSQSHQTRQMPKCAVKSCKFQSQDLFVPPEDERLKKWQAAVGTSEQDFFVCKAHFTKKDLVVDLDDEAIPMLHLSDEIFQLKNVEAQSRVKTSL